MAFRAGTGLLNAGKRVVDVFRRNRIPGMVVRSPLLHAAAAGTVAYGAIPTSTFHEVASTLSRLDVETAGILVAALSISTLVGGAVYAVSRGARSIFNFRAMAELNEKSTKAQTDLSAAQTDLTAAQREATEANTKAGNLQGFRDRVEPLLRQLSPEEIQVLQQRAAAPAAAPVAAPAALKPAAPATPAAPAAPGGLPGIRPLPPGHKAGLVVPGPAGHDEATEAVDRETVDLSEVEAVESASTPDRTPAPSLPPFHDGSWIGDAPGRTAVVDAGVNEAFRKLNVRVQGNESALRGLSKIFEAFEQEDANNIILRLEKKDPALYDQMLVIENLPAEIVDLLTAIYI